MKGLVRTALVFLALWAGKPSTSQAQVDVQLRISPLIGFIAPQGRLYDRETPGAGDWTVSRSFTDLGAFPVIGASLDVGDPALGFWLRARISRSVDLEADFTGLGLYVCPPNTYCLAWYPPPKRFDWELDASVTEYGIDLSLPTRLEIQGIEPQVLVGWGVRHYEFDRPDSSEWMKFLPPGDGTQWSFRIGGGLESDLFGPPLSLSVMDTMSDYWGEFRHHLICELGIPLFFWDP